VARPEIPIPASSSHRSRSVKRKAGAIERTGSRIRAWKRAMIRRRPEPSPPLSYLRTPSPDTWSRSSVLVSDCDADDEDTMSMEDVTQSPPSDTLTTYESRHPKGPFYPQRPTLPDVLSNSAPPPWTLSAFTAYLSSNHCLENLEFTLDAERYKKRYDVLASQMAGTPLSSEMEECGHLRSLWQRLLDAYIMPDCPREINIPSRVRASLLAVSNHTTPPDPDKLKDAVKIIYNLMEESVLISFLNEVPPSFKVAKSKQVRPSTLEIAQRERGDSTSSGEKVSGRSKSRRRGSPKTSSDSPFSPSDPTGRLTPSLNIGKSYRAPSHTSSGSGDPDSMTDDSASGSSPGRELEPMTPPSTPPSSDFGGGSPRSRSDNTWKKMLGWQKKRKSNNGMRDDRFPTVED